ncbi:MAG: DNA primase [Spirochaetales bacterium]|nr:DNA primase [Spirochaetales bacterium]
MAMRIPEETINRITESLDIAAIVGEYVPLVKKGNRYWGLCPFHSEKTPSFAVTPEKGVYYCFGCHKGGSLLTFIMEMEKLSFVEAVQFAAKKAGIEVDFQSRDQDGPKKEAFLELYGRVAQSFAHILKNHAAAEHARRYLGSRHLGEDIQERFSIGYAPPQREWLYDFLRKKNFSEEFLSRSGLFVREKRAYFADRIMFPIANARNEVVAFGGRSLGDAQPKYLNTPETFFFKKGANLYGIDHALPAVKESGFVYLVEGYIDVMAMHASGLANCVAPLGTALTERQARLLKRYCSKAVLVFDGDDAGVQATLRALEIFEACDMETEVVELKERKDPAEIYEKDDSEALHKAMKCSINGFQFILTRATTHNDTATPRGKEGVVAFISSYLSKVQSQIRRDAYIEATAEAIGVREETVRRDLSRPRKFAPATAETAVERIAPEVNDELLFMLAAAVAEHGFLEVRKGIRLEDLQDSGARQLYIALEECFRNDESSMEQLLKRIEDESIKTLLVEKASSEEFAVNQKEYIEKSIRRIKELSLKRKQDEIDDKLKEYDKRKTDYSVLRDLQLEKMYVDEELKKLTARDYGRDN